MSESPPRVAAIHVAQASRLPMRPVEAVDAEAGRGIVGDRYHGTRHRHVSVQSAAALAEAEEVYGAPVRAGLTRRNLTLSQGEVPRTPGTLLQVGGTLLEVVRVAAPCKLLDDTIGRGAQEALRRRAGSICRVLAGGRIEVGDTAVWHHRPMPPRSSSFRSAVDDLEVATYTWPETGGRPRGVVQIAHGLAEHGARYDRLALNLNAAGFVVHATDHRGHGRTGADRLGDFGAAGFDGLIADVAQYGAHLRAETPDLPLFLVAHSMGSFAAQSVLLDHSAQYAGVVLSGSTALDVLAAGLAQSEEPADLGAFNAAFEHRTGYEWLSRDEAEVDAYVADPWCGFDLPGSTLPSLFDQAARLADPLELARIRQDLPLLIASGSDDPLAGGGQLVELLGRRYRDAGLTDVTVRVHDGARHEIFNETNRVEITADVVAWLRHHS